MKDKKKSIAVIILIILVILLIGIIGIVCYYKVIKKDNYFNNDDSKSAEETKIVALSTISKKVASWYQSEEKRDFEEIGIKDNLTKKYNLSDGKWHCLSTLIIGKEDSIFDKNSLKEKNIIKNGNPPSEQFDEIFINSNTCSSAKYDLENGIIILLIANKDGIYQTIKNSVTYAFSNEENGQFGAIIE